MPPSLPIAAYRLQLTPQFTFDGAAAIVPYLAALGVSHVYASPFLRARRGSSHGYDVVDHSMFNPELGGQAGFGRLSDALARANIGLILDFVPNHMAVNGADNRWWLDVLEWGPRSPYAAFFDIDWKRLRYRARDSILLPILGRPYGQALAAGEVALEFDADEGTFSAWYFDHRLPIAPRCYAEILQKAVARTDTSGEAARQHLLDVARQPFSSREDARALKRMLAANAAGAELIRNGLAAYRVDGRDPRATATLHCLLERQHYRIAHWRLAATQINYRRFFDISDLAGLRVEHAQTFDAIHELVLRLVSQGRLHGLRLDHIDGLWDPHAYCEQLQRAIELARPGRSVPFYTVVEKILEPGEPLPAFPGVAGTTGYEWLNVIARVLIDGNGLALLAQTWRSFTGEDQSFDDTLLDSKHYVLTHLLASEFAALADILVRIAAGHRSTRDFAPGRARTALELVVLHFPVYRTYVAASRVTAPDLTVIARTIDAARRNWRGTDEGIFDFLRAVLTLEAIAPGRSTYSSSRVLRFVGKFQQFTGPMMAKSLEDTAFYRNCAVLALNEVGGRPDAGALSVDDFHARLALRAGSPHGMTTTATHDTKRGEDARARLLALSELAHDWAASVEQWRKINADMIAPIDGIRIPSSAHEYLFYQALSSARSPERAEPGFVERIQAFMRKAAREGKQQTSWIDPNDDYERGLEKFVAAALDPARSQSFLEKLDEFSNRIALLGALNSMSQMTLKLMLPGVPDVYQGTELWDLSFVDPDNRRSVDFRLRADVLKQIRGARDWHAIAKRWGDGAIKLALLDRLLQIRRRFQKLFETGDYRPISVTGVSRDHVIAFERCSGDDAIIVAVGRLFASLTDGGRRLPRGSDWQGEIVTHGYAKIELLGPTVAAKLGTRFELSALFGVIPVAILHARNEQ
jgi:(1->4)-alpha-D-glucan 1-alpha-D-glucosylmutase